ncbi:MAG: cupin [Actinomycetota bacterium]
MSQPGTPLAAFPIHLGAGATATVQPEFTGDVAWYADYAARVAADGTDGWLLSMYTFTESWDMWEMHPNGHEIVVCTAGTIRLRQEHADGSTDLVELAAGAAAINPPGTWHTADVDAATTCVFLTAGMGTEHRPR